jgi:hypothetical protein
VGHGPTDHVYTAIEVNGNTILGIDGGQRDDHGFETILLKEHQWNGLQKQSRAPRKPFGAPRGINGWLSLSVIETLVIYHE